MKEDTTLGERLRSLFGKQGLTIISVLTAIGMIIGAIIEAVIPTSGEAVTPPKPTSSQGWVKEWVKKQLHKIGMLLANLAGKAAAASWCDWVYSVMASFSHWESSELVLN